MSTAYKPSPFLRLSPELRLRIYSYLDLIPRSGEDITTINYGLEWPFLDHPSSTTFTPHQLDHCRCPQGPRDANIQTQDHIYTRYLCHGPEVRFTRGAQQRWVLEQPGTAFNILRPERQEERIRRPDIGILLVNKLVYIEVCPLIYRHRNFLCITSICSRGRYQAFATQRWLSLRSPFARSQITTISLLCQENEEDCRVSATRLAYLQLAQFILNFLPRFHTLCLNVRSRNIPLRPFTMLFQREGIQIVASHEDDIYIFREAWQFTQHFEQSDAWIQLFRRSDRTHEEVETILSGSLELRQ